MWWVPGAQGKAQDPPFPPTLHVLPLLSASCREMPAACSWADQHNLLSAEPCGASSPGGLLFVPLRACSVAPDPYLWTSLTLVLSTQQDASHLECRPPVPSSMAQLRMKAGALCPVRGKLGSPPRLCCKGQRSHRCMDRAPGGREVDTPLSLRDSVRRLLPCGLRLDGCAGGQERSVSCVLDDQVCSPGLSITTMQALHGDPWEPCKSPPQAVPGAWKTRAGGSGGGLCCIPCHSPGLGAPQQQPIQVSDAGLWCGVRVTWGPCSCL